MHQEWHGNVRLIRPEADLGHPIGDNESALHYAEFTRIRERASYHLIIDLKETTSINNIGLDELKSTARSLHSRGKQMILINIDHLSPALRRILPDHFFVCPDLPSALVHTATVTL